MKKAIISTSVLAFLLVSGCTSKPSTDNTDTRTYFVIINGGSGKLSPNPTNGYTLTISKTNKLLTWMTDRPYREEGNISLKKFHYDWHHDKNGFASMPPNAEIIIQDLNNKEHFFIAVLKEFNYDESTSTVTFHLKPDATEQNINATCLTPIYTPTQCLTKPITFKYGHVFVEDGPL